MHLFWKVGKNVEEEAKTWRAYCSLVYSFFFLLLFFLFSVHWQLLLLTNQWGFFNCSVQANNAGISVISSKWGDWKYHRFWVPSPLVTAAVIEQPNLYGLLAQPGTLNAVTCIVSYHIYTIVQNWIIWHSRVGTYKTCNYIVWAKLLPHDFFFLPFIMQCKFKDLVVQAYQSSRTSLEALLQMTYVRTKQCVLGDHDSCNYQDSLEKFNCLWDILSMAVVNLSKKDAFFYLLLIFLCQSSLGMHASVSRLAFSRDNQIMCAHGALLRQKFLQHLVQICSINVHMNNISKKKIVPN